MSICLTTATVGWWIYVMRKRRVDNCRAADLEASVPYKKQWIAANWTHLFPRVRRRRVSKGTWCWREMNLAVLCFCLKHCRNVECSDRFLVSPQLNPREKTSPWNSLWEWTFRLKSISVKKISNEWVGKQRTYVVDEKDWNIGGFGLPDSFEPDFRRNSGRGNGNEGRGMRTRGGGVIKGWSGSQTGAFVLRGKA